MARFDEVSGGKGLLARACGLGLAALVLGFWAPKAQAAASDWLDHEQSQVRLISASNQAGTEGTLDLGLQFKLEPGWKIYWRTPGAAGFPPSLEWTQASNVTDSQIAWPVPKRFSLFGLETFGYGGEVVLPITVTLAKAGEAAQISADLNYLICEEICIPHSGTLSLDLPAGPYAPALQGFLIEEAKALVPGDGSAVGLQLTNSALSGTLESPTVEVIARSDRPFENPDLLIEGPRGYGFGKPEVTLSDDRREASFAIAVARSSIAEGVLEGKRLTATVIDGQRGLETEVVARFAALPDAPASAPTTLLAMIGLALLGGLILNLMPCVLPVLSIKLLSVVNQGGRAPVAIRQSFLATAAGILVSFLVLAGVVLLLKAGGMAVGWGIQFQHPLFLSVMALLVTLFACNLFGWFEFSMPGIANRAAELGPQDDSSLARPFLTGVFATLLATPCSAPFLGTAVGFALARGPIDILIIFFALGVGLALPYLSVAVFPQLAARLPKPGAWMNGLRRILGLALVATALWLVTVLVVQVGMIAASAVALLLIALSFLLWLRGRGFGRPLVSTAVVVLALGAVALPGLWPTAMSGANAQQAESKWVTFDPAAIPALVADNKVVFVDITAEWCITCKANKTLVLDQGEVEQQLSDDRIVLMRGDWTLPEEGITDYMARYGRYGVPFNTVYGPGALDGIVLPELLTSDAVLEALGQARGEIVEAGS